MKKVLLLNLVSLLFPFLLKSQALTGIVYDNSTKLPLAYATVYFGGSALWTSTSESGQFAIQATLGNIPLVVSCVGYQTSTINEYSPGLPLKIYLEPKLTELTEVVIRNEGISYEEKLQLFKREFLGITTNGLDCKILNLGDIKLTYNKKEKTLIASSSAPIEIENKKLGYQIQYFLDKFIKSPTGLTFEGNFIFKDIPALATQRQVLRNRERVYKGSRMHFIRALYSNNLEQNGFKLAIPGSYKSVSPDSLLLAGSNGRKLLRLSGKLAISYYNSLSYISQNAKISIIDKTGFHDITLKWAGKMSDARVGDLLPFDYNLKDETGVELDHPFPESNSKADEQNFVAGSLKGLDQFGRPMPRLFFEKVYLHTDRDMYGQGDTLWYKAYVTNAQNQRLIDSSKNLYVELSSIDSAHFISKQMIRIEDGTGRGDFTLSDSIPAGKYQLRAYTRWMQNFGDAFLFQKDIAVLNTATRAESEVRITKNNTENIEPKEDQISNAGLKETPNIRFFPEGGQLIEGLTSLVAIKSEDSYSLGMPVKGSVLNMGGDTVARFSTDSLGFGLLVLKPVKGQQYRASVEGAEPLSMVSFPKPLSKGMNMRISNKDTILQIIIGLNDPENPVNGRKEFSIVGKHRGQVCYSDNFQSTTSESLIMLPTSGFPEGIVSFTLYDNNKPICERLVFIEHGPDSATVVLSTDKQIYQPADSVTIHIKGSPNAHLSIAVVNEELAPVQAGNIVSYLMLESEVKGRIEHPERYFDDKNPNRLKQLDLLLMTHGWREFIWRRLADTTIIIKHEVENGVRVAGKVTDKYGRQPFAGINVSLYASAAKGTKLFSTTTDSVGRFSFYGLDLYGEQLVKLAAMDSKGEKKGTIFLDTIPDFLLKDPPSPIRIVRPEGKAKEAEASLTQRLSDIRKGSIKLKEVKIRASRSVVTREGAFTSWGPEQSFKITEKDHQFKTLAWWMLQNVKGAIPDEGTGVVFMGIEPVRIETPFGAVYRGKYIKMAPKLSVNGRDYFAEDSQQAADVLARFFAMPIEKFDRIVLKPMVGMITNRESEASMINVDRYFLYLTLKSGALDEPDPGSLSPLISGYYTARDFYVSSSAAANGNAGLRATLHWEPSIITNEQGESTLSFKNPAQATTVRIIMQGITEKGNPVTAVRSFLVKSNN